MANLEPQSGVYAERLLTWLLRINAIVLLSAVVPAGMPLEWMAATHRWLGLGELSEGPIVGYLTRSLSAMYAMHGAVVLLVSFDVRRYRELIGWLAVLAMLFGGAMLAIDVAVGMPLWWILSEGPPLVVLGAVLLWLSRRLAAQT